MGINACCDSSNMKKRPEESPDSPEYMTPTNNINQSYNNNNYYPGNSIPTNIKDNLYDRDTNTDSIISLKNKNTNISATNNREYKDVVFQPFQLSGSIDAHTDKIVCLIELKSGSIASGSYDNTIKIWDINSRQCTKTLRESGKVLCLLEFEDNMILSGTNENRIQLWNVHNTDGQSLRKYEGHLLWVNCLVKCNEEYFASASNDSDIRIWNYRDGQNINVLKGHKNCILSMIQLNDGRLCSGSADNTIKIWNWEKGTCESTITEQNNWIKTLYQLSNGYLLTGSQDQKIRVWNNFKIIKELASHRKSIRSFCQIYNNNFV